MATFKKGDTIFTPRAELDHAAPVFSPADTSAPEKADMPETSAAAETISPAPIFDHLESLDNASSSSPVESEPLPYTDSVASPASFSTDSVPSFLPRRRQKLIGPWGYVGYLLLFSIPVVGFIFAIVFACSSHNRNRRNFARGWLLTLLLLVIVIAALGALAYFFYYRPLLAGGGTLTDLLVFNF